MKFIGFFFLFLAIILGVWVYQQNQSRKVSPISPVAKQIIKTVSSTTSKQSSTLFVPYWASAVKDGSLNYDEYVYFGISPDENGINTQEDAFRNLKIFTNSVSGQKILAIRMLNQAITDDAFQNSQLKEKIISQTITLAKQNGFSGILLDLEYPALTFDAVSSTISSFINKFSSAAKEENLQFFTSVYGDTFYRLRPFNVAQIGKDTDGIFIMAYDFHKANGNPGPNFPFSSTEDDYNFQTMLSDFLKVVPKEKITVVFGMYGYDWEVTEKNETIATAKPRSDLEIAQLFIDSCAFSKCLLTRNNDNEPMISYYDSENNKHDIWYEDAISIKKKMQFLKTKGITSTALWAYSYF